MLTILAVGGEAPPRERMLPLFAKAELVCAVDSGLDLLHSHGIAPHLIVGDMDSLAEPSLLELYHAAEIFRLERAKDESDTEAALRLCAARGGRDFVIVGGGGGRLDHLLAIRALFERELRPSSWHCAQDSVFLLDEGTEKCFAFGRGCLISVFPLSRGSSNMSSRGLRWPLDGLSWSAGYYGLSNEALDEEILISAGSGDLLIIRHFDS